ncbi:MAG: recG2 [Proteobacteria bacterium]|nr:recG2 [Pseudomonadota bacterium]
MIADELLSLIAHGESEVLEFKLDSVRNEHLARELGALANYRGGWLILGVSDKREVVGLTRTDNEERIQHLCYSFEPPLQVEVRQVSVQGRSVLTVHLMGNYDKPYAYQSQTRQIYYMRSGTVSREATRAELRRLFQQSAQLHYEITTLQDTDWQDLHLVLVGEYLARYRSLKMGDYSQAEQRTLLHNLALLRDDRLTLLGGLLFGQNKENYLPATGIQVVAYQGLDKADPVISNRYFGKPLIQDLPLLMDYLDIHNPASFDRPVAARQEKRRFPVPALREAVVNAICHRDYTIKGSPILIEFFTDRLVVTSPGGLPNTQTLETVKLGLVYQRNPLLVQYLYDFHYVERIGRGIAIMFAAMREQGHPDPELTAGDSYFRVTLPVRSTD